MRGHFVSGLGSPIGIGSPHAVAASGLVKRELALGHQDVLNVGVLIHVLGILAPEGEAEPLGCFDSLAGCSILTGIFVVINTDNCFCKTGGGVGHFRFFGDNADYFDFNCGRKISGHCVALLLCIRDYSPLRRVHLVTEAVLNSENAYDIVIRARANGFKHVVVLGCFEPERAGDIPPATDVSKPVLDLFITPNNNKFQRHNLLKRKAFQHYAQ